jgi:hypothetical protein
VEFYKADLATMTMKQSSVLRIDYLHIKEYSPKPSYALISDSERYLTICPWSHDIMLINNVFVRSFPDFLFLE